MSILRALLVDDERLARKRLAGLLAAHPQIQVIGEADGLEAAATMVANLRPDVVFLDIEMPPDNGLELLARLPESFARRRSAREQPLSAGRARGYRPA